MRNANALLTHFALAAFIGASSVALADEPLPDRTVTTPAAVPAVVSRDLAAVNDKLNSIKTLKATFTQTDAQGTVTGHFYLSRPGGLRFEYDPPRKLLVVANNSTVMVQENPKVAGYRVGIDQTPLRLLLKPNVDLARDAHITDVHRESGMLLISAVQTEGYAQGAVTFAFAEPSLDLRSWIVTDAMGAKTAVVLDQQVSDVALDKSMFALPRIETGVGPPR
jgi:outer membrane lipoprotein-sorting protein